MNEHSDSTSLSCFDDGINNTSPSCESSGGKMSMARISDSSELRNDSTLSAGNPKRQDGLLLFLKSSPCLFNSSIVSCVSNQPIGFNFKEKFRSCRPEAYRCRWDTDLVKYDLIHSGVDLPQMAL